MKWIGICILLFTFFLASRELAARRRRRTLIYEECYRFIQHVRLQVGCYLKPVCELACGFESPVLCEVGFLSRLEGGVSPRDAIEASSLRRELGEEGYRVLFSMFSAIGGGYMDDEIKLIDECASAFLRLVERERSESPRGLRLIRTLCGAAALGIIIFAV